MIPYGDDLGRRGLQPVTALSVLALAACYGWLWWLPPERRPACEAWFALDLPALREQLRADDGRWAAQASVLLRGLRGCLQHAGLLHGLANVLFLITCGGRLEARAGPLRFLLFVLLTAMAGLLAAIRFAVAGQPPSVGAGAVVAGCAVALTVLLPRLHVRWLLPVLVWPVRVEMPVLAVLPVWAALQLPALLHLLAPTAAAVPMPWPAAVAGGLAGLVLGPLLLGRPRRRSGGGKRRGG